METFELLIRFTDTRDNADGLIGESSSHAITNNVWFNEYCYNNRDLYL